MRTALMMLIYEKTLHASREDIPPAGKLLTLLTTDANLLALLVPLAWQFFFIPVQLIGDHLFLSIYYSHFS